MLSNLVAIDFILDFFGVGGLYWSLAFLLNLLDNNFLTVSQTTSWESLA
jgi:cytochrome c oxidase subunit IV